MNELGDSRVGYLMQHQLQGTTLCIVSRARTQSGKTTLNLKIKKTLQIFPKSISKLSSRFMGTLDHFVTNKKDSFV